MESDKELELDSVPGVLSFIDLSKSENDILLDFLDKEMKCSYPTYLYAVLGKDRYLKFFDVLAGRKINVPTRQHMEKIILYVRIYAYCKSKGFTDESKEVAAKIFNKRVVAVNNILKKVDKVLNNG